MSSSTDNSRWARYLAAIIAVGLLSRVVPTGFELWDKYLGDALYAAMVYALARRRWASPRATIIAAVIMLALELFQLSELPRRMLASDRLAVRVCAHLLGTQFSFADLAAYAVGIGCIYLLDRPRR